MPPDKGGLDFRRPLQLDTFLDPLDDTLVLLQEGFGRRVDARFRVEFELGNVLHLGLLMGRGSW